MKLFIMIFLSLFVGKNCTHQTKNDMKTAVLVYTASTRGFYQKIIIKDQMVSVSRDRSSNDKPVGAKISEKDWKELVSYFETMNLEDLSTLKAHSKKRLYDGAAIAHLQVSYKDKSYQTASFDHGYPPEAIKKIVDKINTFAKKDE